MALENERNLIRLIRNNKAMDGREIIEELGLTPEELLLALKNCRKMNIPVRWDKVERAEDIADSLVRYSYKPRINGKWAATDGGSFAVCFREFCEYRDKTANYCPFRYCIYSGQNYYKPKEEKHSG